MRESTTPKGKNEPEKEKRKGVWSVVPAPYASIPDGERLDDYVGYETWPPARWAWEFLRRNKEFQDDCDALPSDETELTLRLKEIIRKYGLGKFKHWKEEFGEAEENQPIFDSVRFRVNLNDAPMETSDIPNLKKGQALILVELLPCLDDLGLIQRQLEFAKNSLERQIENYILTNNLKRPVRRKPKTNRPQDLISLLRLLDLRNQEKTKKLSPTERFKLLFAKREDEDDGSWAEKEKGRFKTARGFCRNGYLTLALL
ncbi:transcriptional regulator domain-containing protein [Achromobacter xylosoxidans]